MTRQVGVLIALAALFCFADSPPRAEGETFAYHTPEVISGALKVIAKQSQGAARVRKLCETPGGRELTMLEFGREGSDRPAILVVANMEGNCPIASEAALRLAGLLGDSWIEERDAYRWYVIAAGNPDGLARFFESPLTKSFVNGQPVNDDNDDATDEDGPEDLNRDGFITMMRQQHPEGQWIAVDDQPLLMRKADNGKGESGIWRTFSEGIDNDGDGTINEDGPGGTNPGRNFPHNFEHYRPANGPWAASEVESRAILRFAFDHPEIAMILTFGRTNSLKDVPENSRKAEAGGGKYKVPGRWAERLGLDADKEYPIDDLLDLARDYTGYRELTEDQLLQWLGVGAAANPNKKDVPYWKEISKRYNDFIEEAELDSERLDPPGFSDGCIEEWAYYQYGVPSFSMDFWTLPKPEKEEKDTEDGALSPDDVEKMSSEDFIALGDETIDELLKASGVPAQFTAEMVIKGLESGRMTTKRIAKYMSDAKDKEDGEGGDKTEEALLAFDSSAFVPWKPYDHPTLGKVEIGGRIAYRDLTPPPGLVDSLLAGQLPFVRDLVKLLPKIAIDKVSVEEKRGGIWKVEAWIANEGFLPYPTHQGERSERPRPVVVTIAGDAMTLLEGKERNTLGLLAGSGGTDKVTWLVQAPAGERLTITAHSFSAGGERRTITLTEGGGQ